MLISNGSRLNCNPMRIMAGAGALNDLILPRVTAVAKKNQTAIFGDLSSTPVGYYHPGAWVWPRSPGALSSHYAAQVSLAASGGMAKGLSFPGTASIIIDASGTLSAIKWVAGTAAISINGTLGGPTLTTATIAAAIWQYVAEGALSTEEILRILLAVQVGKTTISLTPPVTVRFRDQADTKNRVVGEMEGSERVTVTLNPD